MAEQTTGTYTTSLSSENTDRLLVTVDSREDANKLRNQLLSFKPRPWVFVIRDKEDKDKWNIFISNEWGGYPSDEQFNATLDFAEDCLLEAMEEDGCEVLTDEDLEYIDLEEDHDDLYIHENIETSN